MNTSPHILIVDDEPDPAGSAIRAALAPQDAVITARHPQDITDDDLSGCAVLVVDHYLDHWGELDSQRPAMRPRDGFALAAVLRSQIRTDRPGPAVTILTGQMSDLAGELPLKAAEHLLAWQHDVEWVFAKGTAVAPRLLALAEAVEALRRTWITPFEVDHLSTKWLNLPDEPWSGVALDHITQTRPPIHSLGTRTAGASILRWFLQRILPYPTFLTDVFWIASRLGVTVTWLKAELRLRRELHKSLASCAYSGSLADFMGLRWWRAGLANMMVELTHGSPFDRQALQAGIRELSSSEPAFLSEDRPVLAVDPNTMEPTRLVEATAAVQIVPDGWPVFADAAWISIEDLSADPSLADWVLDRSRWPNEADL